MLHIPQYKEPKTFFQLRLGAGPKAAVYSLSNDYVVKVRIDGWGPFQEILRTDAAEFALNSNFRVLDELYHRGISVPKPIGLYRVKIRPIDLRQSSVWFHPSILTRPFSYPGIVLQRVHGKFIGNTPKELRKKLTELALEEASKAIIAGLDFSISDFDPTNNAMWDGKKVILTGLDYYISGVFRESPKKPTSKSN